MPCKENDNLRGEYSELYKYVAKDIPWARIALGQEPDAINLWIGNSKSITALHKDNYENIYCQLVGSKHFVLLPPVESACVNEKLLPSAHYSLNHGSVSASMMYENIRYTLKANSGRRIGSWKWKKEWYLSQHGIQTSLMRIPIAFHILVCPFVLTFAQAIYCTCQRSGRIIPSGKK